MGEGLLKTGEEEASCRIVQVLAGVEGVEVAPRLILADLPALSFPEDPSHQLDQVISKMAWYQLIKRF